MKNLNIFMQTVIYLSVFIFNTFLVSTLSLRFVFPLVSLEGLTFWRIKSAPVNIKRYLFTKLIPYLLFIIIISLILNTVVNIQFPVRLLLFSSFVTLISAVSLVMINFGMGSYFAVFKEKNPIRIASSQGASLSFLINILYMIILVSILFYPINEYFTLSGKTDKTDISSLITAAVLITTLSVMIFSFFYITLTKSLKRDF